VDLPPERVVEEALRTGCKSIAYTYTEPTVFFEYALDTSRIARRKGLKNVFVTNGYMTPEMIEEYDCLDAANVDVKGDQDFYREVCGAEMQGVLDSIRLLHEKGVHVEVTNLIIPGYNDDKDSITQISEFVKDLDPDVPLHFSAFYPCYKLTEPPRTKRETLVKARKIALEEGVNYVYCGNTFPGDPFDNTYCPNCGAKVIERQGFSVTRVSLEGNKCPECGHKVRVVLE
jgi:pyruvate formate lyase activating enzyme